MIVQKNSFQDDHSYLRNTILYSILSYDWMMLLIRVVQLATRLFLLAHRYIPSCNFVFLQKNSFEDDYTQLRKTKSAENIRCPQIVINQVGCNMLYIACSILGNAHAEI